MEVCLQRLNYCSQRLGGYAVCKGWWYWLYPSDIFWGRKNTGHVWLSSGVDRVWFLCGILPAHTDRRRREITWSTTIVSQDLPGSWMLLPCWVARSVIRKWFKHVLLFYPLKEILFEQLVLVFSAYLPMGCCMIVIFFWNWQGISLPWHCQFLLGPNYASICFGCFAQERLLVDLVFWYVYPWVSVWLVYNLVTQRLTYILTCKYMHCYLLIIIYIWIALYIALGILLVLQWG